MKLVYSGCWKA